MVHVPVVAEVAFATGVFGAAQSDQCYTLAESVGFASVIATTRKAMRHVEGCSDIGVAE